MVAVRTLWVALYKVYDVDKVKVHFQRFGEIESVSMRSENELNLHCFVQFKRQEDAAKALQSDEKPWKFYEAIAADELIQPDHPLNTPPNDVSPNIVSVLNDDCMQEVLRRLKLLADLTNVAGVCKRFNQQAKITFASQYEQFHIGCESLLYRGLFGAAMHHFGKDIRSLIASPEHFKTEGGALELIARYCGPKLKRLELYGFGFGGHLPSLKLIFAGLEHLALSACGSSNALNELMASCVELKSLGLSHEFGDYHLTNDCSVLNQTFPNYNTCQFFPAMPIDKFLEVSLRVIQSCYLYLYNKLPWTQVSTVQQRKEKVSLVIEIHGEANQVNVPATVLEENHKTLNVKMIFSN